MEMLEYFEMVINYAIQNEIANELMPKEFDVEATAEGWEVSNRNEEGCEKLYITLEVV